ncbi:hypothetical protein QBC34DRAFT_470990 [Podospora aff. communis PSN243]|uniref:Uncharacterized protein n=1 Tax=Podospora aff. communis PSN243 TaxID=3040156 RepID=A0AAV9H2H9_9PEZI|nr:hypothetical protein QBC34DRAFT_470990 [Podospora aff. communis PSN243]
MHLKKSLVAGLGLLGSTAWAGYDARSAEALFFYQAYRMDVEISSELARARGEDPAVTKPWMIANSDGKNYVGSYNDPLDWPNGVEDRSRLGLNFHAFIQGTQRDGSRYGRIEARKRVADPWMPTLQDFADVKNGDRYVTRNNIARLDPDGGKLDWIDPITNEGRNKNAERFSFTGFNPGKVLGKLNLHNGDRNSEANYFDFDNMMSTVARRCAWLYEQDPVRGAAHMNRIKLSLDEARGARNLESKKYAIEGLGRAFDNYNQQKGLGQGTLSSKHIKADTRTVNYPGSIFHGWQFKEFSMRETRLFIESKVKVSEATRNDIRDLMIRVGEAFQMGRTVPGADYYGSFRGEEKTHGEVVNREFALSRAIERQMQQNGNPQGCDWGTPKYPGNNFVEPPGTILDRSLHEMFSESRSERRRH